MTELVKGNCQFVIIQDVSKKSGNNYKRLKLIFPDGYEKDFITVVNDEMYYCIRKASEK